jgi:hypothetical protein
LALYETRNMFVKDAGTPQQKLLVPPIEVKGKLLHLPPGRTLVGNTTRSVKKRETMVANAWQVRVAAFLLKIVLVQYMQISTQNATEASCLQVGDTLHSLAGSPPV